MFTFYFNSWHVNMGLPDPLKNFKPVSLVNISLLQSSLRDYTRNFLKLFCYPKLKKKKTIEKY